MEDITGDFTERRSTQSCPNHEQVTELRDDYYAFKELQIATNESCGIKLEHLYEMAQTSKSNEDDCVKKVLPGMKKSINTMVTISGVVGLIFVLLMFFIENTHSEANEAKSKANEAISSVTLIQNDIEYIQEDIEEMKEDQKVTQGIMLKILEKLNDGGD